MVPFALIGCSGVEFRNAEIIDIKVGYNGAIAVAYYSNETVNVYSFDKLVRTFRRRSAFVSVGTNTYGSYYKIYSFGFLPDNRIYIVAYKPMLGHLVRVGEREMGYYTFVTEFAFSEAGRFGFIYNVGGEFSGSNVSGGKYFVNVDGMDYGPYDYAEKLSFSRDGGLFYVFRDRKEYGLRVNEHEYIGYTYVIPPRRVENIADLKFVYRVGRKWFLYPGQEISSNVVGIVFFENGYCLMFSNSNSTLITGFHTNFSVEGRVLDLLHDDKWFVLSQVGDGKKVVYDGVCGTYYDVGKYQIFGGKLVFEYKSNGFWYINFRGKDFGPFEFVDFVVEGDRVFVGHVVSNRIESTYLH